MEETPANYNKQNQGGGGFDGSNSTPHSLEKLQQDIDNALRQGNNTMMNDDIDSPIDGLENSGYELLNRRKKKKKYKVAERWEDPNIRERLLAGAYGGVACSRPKNKKIVNNT
jgi:hypothetical protein